MTTTQFIRVDGHAFSSAHITTIIKDGRTVLAVGLADTKIYLECVDEGERDELYERIMFIVDAVDIRRTPWPVK